MATVEDRIAEIEKLIKDVVYLQMKNEMAIHQLQEEMKEFKNEMRQFKDEMRQFKDEVRQEHKRMNKQWGELANKLGTIVEDIVYPATKPVLESHFKCEITDIAMNIKRKRGDYKDEFDIIAVSEPCKAVYLIEVKSTVREYHIENFPKKADSFKKLFPEYDGYTVVPVLASLRFEEDKLNLATKNKIYAMAYREWEYMDLLNFEEIQGD